MGRRLLCPSADGQLALHARLPVARYLAVDRVVAGLRDAEVQIGLFTGVQLRRVEVLALDGGASVSVCNRT
jgi:hypothetical protein